MKLGILAAVRTELRPTLRLLHPDRRRIEDRTFYERGSFVFTAGGIGTEAAAEAAERLAERFRPDALVSTGFAGALRDDWETGDLILGGSTGFPPTDALLDAARRAAPGARVAEIRTVERVLRNAREKRRLAEGGAAAVDMESAAVGETARRRGLGFLCVKAVLDTPSAPLASDYAGLMRVLGEVVRCPRALAGIAADAARARKAAARLAEFFRAFARAL
jgi:nucleoside phosphorylase